MSQNKMLKLKRLQKQQQQLNKDSISNVLVARDGVLNFHFVIYNLDGEYKDGYYHGLLQLHENYPFAAPKLFFYTPNGRFQINVPICTSFTNYHQESWTSAWNVRSLLLGTVSFMTSTESSYGCRNDCLLTKRTLALKSLQHNLKSQKFRELFLDKLKKINAPIPQNQDPTQQIDMSQKLSPQPNVQQVDQGDQVNQILLNNLAQRENGQIQRPARRQQNKCKRVLLGCMVVGGFVGSLWFLSKFK